MGILLDGYQHYWFIGINKILFLCRSNLDPYNVYKDDDLWRALHQVHLADIISKKTGLGKYRSQSGKLNHLKYCKYRLIFKICIIIQDVTPRVEFIDLIKWLYHVGVWLVFITIRCSSSSHNRRSIFSMSTPIMKNWIIFLLLL